MGTLQGTNSSSQLQVFCRTLQDCVQYFWKILGTVVVQRTFVLVHCKLHILQFTASQYSALLINIYRVQVFWPGSMVQVQSLTTWWPRWRVIFFKRQLEKIKRLCGNYIREGYSSKENLLNHNAFLNRGDILARGTSWIAMHFWSGETF